MNLLSIQRAMLFLYHTTKVNLFLSIPSSYSFINQLSLVYEVKCDGPCACESVYQGHEQLLFDINNRYLVHYGLLYEYSELVRTGRNPLFAFVR